MNVALTIAGSDSGGGAGIQADIKAIEANGVFAASVITAVTAQNTIAVTRAFELPLEVIEAQLDAVYDDITIHATKTGMLSSAEVIELVARTVEEREVNPLVVDPVMISKSGFKLLRDDAIETLKNRLIPLATLVTPNLDEARILAGMDVASIQDVHEAAAAIMKLGPRAVLIKGGHLRHENEAVDVLFDGMHFHAFTAPMLDSKNTHGSGCTYASAIAANLAKGFRLRESIAQAKRYVTEAIRNGFAIGEGHGPTHHFYFLRGSRLFPAEDDE